MPMSALRSDNIKAIQLPIYFEDATTQKCTKICQIFHRHRGLNYNKLNLIGQAKRFKSQDTRCLCEIQVAIGSWLTQCIADKNSTAKKTLIFR